MGKREVEPESIPEVMAYRESRDMLDAFMQSNIEVFEAYKQLVADVNQKREAADKVVRAKNVSCGDWDIYQEQTKYDPQLLYEALGREQFMRVGGSCETQTVYGLDKAKFEAAYARGEVPDEVREVVRTVSPRYKAPKEIT
jgi:hypothetical protein